jgi:hypothetical protein
LSPLCEVCIYVYVCMHVCMHACYYMSYSQKLPETPRDLCVTIW